MNQQNIIQRRLVTDNWLENFSKTGNGQLKTLTNSMSPLIQAGDSVCIKRMTVPSKIHIGDILAFWHGNMLITHRVIRKIKKNNAIWFLERADRSPQTSLVKQKDVVGRVSQIIKKDSVFDLESNKMKLCNRVLGFIFLSEWIIRLYGNRVKGPFCFLKTTAKHFYLFLKSLLHRLMSKSVKTK